MAKNDDHTSIHYAGAAYGFLIALPRHRNRGFTAAELADAIEAVYDMNNPRNAAVVKILRQYPNTQFKGWHS